MSIRQLAVSLNTPRSIKLDGVLKIEPLMTIIYIVDTEGGKLNMTLSYVHFRGTVYDLSNEGDEENFSIVWEGSVSPKDRFNFSAIAKIPFEILVGDGDKSLRSMGYLLPLAKKNSLTSSFNELVSTSPWDVWDFESKYGNY